MVDTYVLLGFYAALTGSFLSTFRDNLSIPFQELRSPRTMSGTAGTHLHREWCGRWLVLTAWVASQEGQQRVK